MTWLEIDPSSHTVEIVTSPTCLLRRDDRGALHLHTGVPGGWAAVSSDPATVQAAGPELHTGVSMPFGSYSTFSVYRRHRDGSVFETYQDVSWAFQPHAARRDPATVALDDPQEWTRLDDNPATVEIAAGGGRLFQRHADGSVWEYTGVPMTGWDLIDSGHAVERILATGPHLYRLDADGRIATYDGGPSGWRELDDNPASAAVAAVDSSLFQLHEDGRIFAHRGGWWELLDDNPASVEITVADHLYQRHADGSVWMYTGVPLTGWTQLDAAGPAVQIAARGPALHQRRADGSVHQFVA